MDPFSPEILGVKTEVAAFFEKLGLYQKAIDTLEQVRADCLKWNEYFGDKPENSEKRTRLLATAVRFSLKLGEYYGQPSIGDRDAVEAKLVWAVTAILKENQRRQEAGSKSEDLDTWISQEETGAVFERTIPFLPFLRVSALPFSSIYSSIPLLTSIESSRLSKLLHYQPTGPPCRASLSTGFVSIPRRFLPRRYHDVQPRQCSRGAKPFPNAKSAKPVSSRPNLLSAGMGQ